MCKTGVGGQGRRGLWGRRGLPWDALPPLHPRGEEEKLLEILRRVAGRQHQGAEDLSELSLLGEIVGVRDSWEVIGKIWNPDV